MSFTKNFVIDHETRQKVYFDLIEDGRNYDCSKCNGGVHFRLVRRAYHNNNDKNGDGSYCNNFHEHSESYEHMAAKDMIIETFNKNKRIIIERNCVSCGENKKYKLNSWENLRMVAEQNFGYKGHLRRADLAIINIYEENKIEVIIEICHTNPTAEDVRPEPWFELGATDVLAAVQRGDNSFVCMRRKCDKCRNREVATALKGRIFFNQRGAGCGKTYESIQLIRGEKEVCRGKDKFIYLTKMNSAKDVIHSEIKEQVAGGKLPGITLEKDEDSGNQYRFTAVEEAAGRYFQIYVGTIDSFTYALSEDRGRGNEGMDFFAELVKSISVGNNLKGGEIRYARQNFEINERCLIIIDEAQDLNRIYLDAFKKILDLTKIDVYIIGDYLQSIWGRDNIFEYVLHQTAEINADIVKSAAVNVVRRFHNNQFVKLVNDHIRFNKFGLVPVEGICPGGGSCGYVHEDEICPFGFIENGIPTFLSADEDDGTYKKRSEYIIENILEKMRFLVQKYKYIPQNFMFIFPFLKGKKLAADLETAVQNFWREMFEDEEYVKILKEKSKFWRKNIDNFFKYIFLHRAEVGGTIDLKESENSSRILTIHSSKGSGCEVVFLMEMSDYAFEVLGAEVDSLKYESLLHVALTRQKKYLYINFKSPGDNISRRFDEYRGGIAVVKNKRNIKLKDLMMVDDDDVVFNYINNNILEPQKLRDKIKKDETGRRQQNIDWGYHVICYNTMKYMFLFKLLMQNKGREMKDHFFTSLRNVCKYEVQVVGRWYEYNGIINGNRNISGNNVRTIPILQYFNPSGEIHRSYRFFIILKEYIELVKAKVWQLCDKILKGEAPVINLCPLEIFILAYMRYSTGNDLNAEVITIGEIYYILYCFEECSNSIKIMDNGGKTHSQKFKCPCEKLLNKNNESANSDTYAKIRTSITNHICALSRIKTLKSKLDQKLFEDYGISLSDFQIKTSKSVECGRIDKYKSNIELIAFSDEYVLSFHFKPTFNNINFNETITAAVSNNIALRNCNNIIINKAKNYVGHEQEWFRGKRIINIILSFDFDQPIIFEFDNFDKHEAVIKNLLDGKIDKIYDMKHEEICKGILEGKLLGLKEDDPILKSLPEYMRKVINFYSELVDGGESLPAADVIKRRLTAALLRLKGGENYI